MAEEKTKKNKLYSQLLEVQKKIEVASKDSNNPFYKSKYADLNSIMGVAKPVLSENDLFIAHLGVFIEGQYCITTRVYNTEGEFLECIVPVVSSKPTDPQAQGSSTTYARRYGLQTLLAIETEDDDGNEGNGKKPKATTTTIRPQTPPEEPDGVTDADLEEMFRHDEESATLVDKYGKDNFFGSPYTSRCPKCADGLIYMKDFNGKKFEACNNYGKVPEHPKK